jgi:sterol 3beta-glucosyltransferase
MKLAVVTYGTEGDTRLAALARALIDAGHEVHLLADASTLHSAEALDVPASALSGDIRKALAPGQALSNAVYRKGGFQDTSRALAAIANASTPAWMREVAEASEGCDALIISGLTAFVGLSVAEYRGIPAIGTGLIPITPTADFASPFLPPGKVPRWLNRASHRLVNELLWQAFKKTTNAARADVCGLPARKHVWSDHPMLYGVSPSLLPRPRDWAANAFVCGQWSAATTHWMPPPALEAFLAAGEAPIYIGFGSMAGFDHVAMTDALITAIAGRRALFYPAGAALMGCHCRRTSSSWARPRIIGSSPDVDGDSSRRIGYLAFGGAGRHTVGGGAVRGRSVLLGAAATGRRRGRRSGPRQTAAGFHADTGDCIRTTARGVIAPGHLANAWRRRMDWLRLSAPSNVW